VNIFVFLQLVNLGV